MLNTLTALNTSLFQHPRRGFRVLPSLLRYARATARQGKPGMTTKRLNDEKIMLFWKHSLWQLIPFQLWQFPKAFGVKNSF